MNTVNNRIILLVEDNIADQKFAIRAFEKCNISEIDLRIVNNGREAMNYLLQLGKYSLNELSPRPDLILLDINMPRMDGKQVLKEIKSNSELKSIPIIMLTTSVLEKDIRESYILGASSFINKPELISDFVYIIKKIKEYWFDLNVLPYS